MNKKQLNKINNKIIKCDERNSIPPCSRDQSACPFVMPILKASQRIMLITRDPSNEANRKQAMLKWDNSFFRTKILPIIFKDYKEEYFDKYSKLFSNIVYWTHYSKCFPGITKRGQHKQPNDLCAKIYLKKEISSFHPDITILMGKHSIEYLTEINMIDAISNNGNNTISINNNIYQLICLTHPGNANNKCKNDPRYKYKETIKMIQKSIERLLKRNN